MLGKFAIVLFQIQKILCFCYNIIKVLSEISSETLHKNTIQCMKCARGKKSSPAKNAELRGKEDLLPYITHRQPRAVSTAGMEMISPYFTKVKKENFTECSLRMLSHMMPARAPTGVSSAPRLLPRMTE